MSQSANEELVQAGVAQLEAYSLWQEATAERQKIFDVLPNELDPNNKKYLSQQLSYLDTKEEELKTRKSFALEFAGQDDGFMPLIYRLGVLAALKATEEDEPRHAGDWHSGASFLGMRYAELIKEDKIHRSSDPIKLGVQIGEELGKLLKALNGRAPVPVVMVQNHHCVNCKIDYSDVLKGVINPPTSKSLELKTPKIKGRGDDRTIEFTIPSHLKGVRELELISWEHNPTYVGDFARLPVEYDGRKSFSPEIPRLRVLASLGGISISNFKHSLDALYIGRKEAGPRIKKALVEKAMHEENEERERSARPRRSVLYK